MNSLKLLQTYESESSDEEKNNELKSTCSTKLVVPDVIEDLFNKKVEKAIKESHSGRKRSFAHQPGNWATHIFVPYPYKKSFDLIQEVNNSIENFKGDMEWHSMKEIHLSLSKTVVLAYHQIQPMYSDLKNLFTNFYQFKTYFSSKSLSFFTNEEKTRSFLGFKIDCYSIREKLKKAVSIIDEAMTAYNCDKYYKNPSFHISIAWCLGDVSSHKDSSHILDYFKTFWSNIENENSTLMSFEVTHIFMKSGNKLLTFSLKQLD